MLQATTNRHPVPLNKSDPNICHRYCREAPGRRRNPVCHGPRYPSSPSRREPRWRWGTPAPRASAARRSTPRPRMGGGRRPALPRPGRCSRGHGCGPIGALKSEKMRQTSSFGGVHLAEQPLRIGPPSGETSHGHDSCTPKPPNEKYFPI